MNEKITVEKAINRFWTLIMLPTVFGALGLPVISIYIGVYHESIIYWVIPFGIISGILFAYFNWTIGLYKWHVWAYYSVDNIYELEIAIVLYHFVYWGDWKERLSKNDQEKYNAIQQRINEPYIFEDDYSVPNETAIRYSIILSVVYLTICLCGLLLGILSITHKHSIQGIVFIAIALGFTIWQLINSLDRTPKIILDNDGITTISLGFNKWEDIYDEKVTLSALNGRYFYLTYTAPNGQGKVKINNLAISPARLNHLLLVYRTRKNQTIRKFANN